MNHHKATNYLSDFYLATRLTKEYVLPNLNILILSIILMVIIAATTSLHAWLVKPVFDEVFFKQDRTALIWVPIAVFSVTIIKGLATYFQLFTMNLISLRMTLKMRNTLYAHFIYSDIADLHNSSSGEMIAKMTNEVTSIVSAISTLFNGSIKQFFTLLFLIGVMFYQSVELSLIAFVGFPLAAYPIYKISRRLRRLSFVNQNIAQKFNSQMSDTLQYSKLVKAYNCEDFEVNRMGKIIEESFRISKKITRMSLIASPFVETISGIGVALVIWYGGSQMIKGLTTPGAFSAFFTAMLMAYRPLKSVSSMNSGIQAGLAAAERFYSIIDQKPKIIDNPSALNLTHPKGDIKFEEVGFSYDGSKVILKNINLEIPSGKTIALVGPSGGGKSTIMNLLLRFYDPTEGRILLDSHDLKNLTLKSLRNNIAIVNQEVMLFDDTILENIRYGKEDATKEDIIRAAKLAEADDFIKQLSEGYDTKIGQNGIRISGGQRQRIAIARAILYNAPILLLDEATSALDPISENLVKNALKKLMQGRTTLVIAHRLSTVRHADKICVVINGEITESGTHLELLNKNGEYANLYSKQFEIKVDE